MFFLLPRITLILLVLFLGLMGWRLHRQRREPRGAPRRRAASRRRGHQSNRLVPAALLKGADRTWVVFGTPDCEVCGEVARRLADADPGSQVTEVDVRREPRLAEAFGVRQLPGVLLANRYGEVEARLVGRAAIDAYRPGRP